MCLFRFNGPTSNTLLEVASPKTKKILPGPTVEVKTFLPGAGHCDQRGGVQIQVGKVQK